MKGPFLCKYQQLQKYKVENDRLCCSSSEDLKILAEHDQVPPNPCKIEKSSLECVVGSTAHKVLEMILSLSWVTVLSTQPTMEQLRKAQGEQEEYSEG